jgi:hypothetical protein
LARSVGAWAPPPLAGAACAFAWLARHKAAIGKQRMARVTYVARVACVFMHDSLKKTSWVI